MLGFIFNGANMARSTVPLRFRADLMLASWMDENIINWGGLEKD